MCFRANVFHLETLWCLPKNKRGSMGWEAGENPPPLLALETAVRQCLSLQSSSNDGNGIANAEGTTQNTKIWNLVKSY